MTVETAEDLKLFFNPEDFEQVAECIITGPNGFSRTLTVDLSTRSEPVTLYETNVESPEPSFLCREVDLMTAGVVDVRRGMTATVRGLQFTVARIAMDQAGTATVFLSE